MEQYKDGHYDDDLTVGIDEYDEDFDTGAADLFEYVGDDDSPLARLKSIILSIDWEINDDILRQFNEELLDLKDIWAGNKINLIYVQALEKLSKYIYKEKADAHPKAIRLLLTFYTNLERIVSSDVMSDQEKKEVLVEDVQRFEKLKKQIGRASSPVPAKPVVAEPVQKAVQPERPPKKVVKESPFVPDAQPVVDGENPLLNLKAIVYGIDWEITERDLTNLSKEVKALEKEFQNSKARLIFLQGIGSLGAYINLKRSDAHADAFKLLHSFFIGLETIVKNKYTGLQEKEILLPEVEKFNKFKASVADTISPEAIAKSSARDEEFDDDDFADEIQPAFSDMPEDVRGFQEEEELAALQEKEEDYSTGNFQELDEEPEEQPILGRGEEALTNEMETRLDGLFDEPGKEEIGNLEAEVALQGVDVETDADDDSEEEPLPKEGGELAPALAAEEDSTRFEESPALFSDKLDGFFGDPEVEETPPVGTHIPGIDVETDADDDSDETPLPFEGGELAPALSADIEDEEIELEMVEDKEVDQLEIDDRLSSFFDGKQKEEKKTEEIVFTDSAEEEAPAFVSADDDAIESGLKDEDEFVFGEDIFSPEEDELFAEITDTAEQEQAVALDQANSDEKDEEDLFAGASAEDFADQEVVLKGVDVETDADDDSEEDTLLFEDGELAPALSLEEEEQIDNLTGEAARSFEEDAEERVAQQFDSFFASKEDVPLQEEEKEDGPHEKAGFEEISDDDLDEIPEDLVVPLTDDFDLAAQKQDVTADEIEGRLDGFLPGEEELSASDQESLALLGVDTEDEDGEEDEEDLFAESFDAKEGDVEMEPAFSDLSDDIKLEDESFLDDIEEIASEDVSVFLEESEETLELIEDEEDLLSDYDNLEEKEQAFGFISHPEDNTDYIISVEGLETSAETKDEVVFELVDDEEELAVEAEGELPNASEIENDSDTFGTVVLSDKMLGKAASAKKASAAAPKKPAGQDFLSSDVGFVQEPDLAYVDRHAVSAGEDNLNDLRNCIVSLGLEINDEILTGLSEEIEKLRHAWMNKPIEKSFAQLLATVAQHIDKYRYDADPEANKLLLSVFDKLEICTIGGTDAVEMQEILLIETSKVLTWQQRLVDRKLVTGLGEMEDFARKVEQVEKAPQFTKPAAAVDSILGDAGVDKTFSGVIKDIVHDIDDGDEKDAVMKMVSSIMKSEMDQLRSTFLQEIKELKDEIRRTKR